MMQRSLAVAAIQFALYVETAEAVVTRHAFLGQANRPDNGSHTGLIRLASEEDPVMLLQPALAARVETLRAVLSPDLISWAVTLAVIGVILAMFLRNARTYLGSLRVTSHALAEATRLVKGDNRDTPERVFPKGPKRLQDLWQRFLDEREGTTRVYRGEKISTLAPEEIFHEQAILDAYNRNFAVTLAGFFTGLGIFGTFLGLVIGLGSVDIDVQSQQLMESVGGLVAGMATAFWTSLAGILASLVWLYLDRTLYNSVQRAADAFFRKVRRHYPVESADRLLHRLLTVEEEEATAIIESRGTLEEQKAILQDLSFDLASAFQESLNKSLSETLVPTLSAVATTLNDLSANVGQRQVAALDEMVGAFQARLSEELGGQFENLANALANAADWQHKVHSQLGTLIDRIQAAGDGLTHIIEQSKTAGQLFAESLTGLQRAHEEISGAADLLQRTTEGLSAALRELAADLAKQVAGVGSEAKALEQRIAELDRQHIAYREANEAIRLQLANQIDTIDEQVDALTQFWGSFRNELGHVGDRLKASVEEFRQLTAEKLREIFARFDTEMARVVDHLGGTLAEIREVTIDLPEAVDRFGRILGETMDPLTKAGTALEELPAIERSLTTISDTAPHLEPLAAAIAAASGKADETRKSLEMLSGHIHSLDERLAAMLRLIPRLREGGPADRDGQAHITQPEAAR